MLWWEWVPLSDSKIRDSEGANNDQFLNSSIAVNILKRVGRIFESHQTLFSDALPLGLFFQSRSPQMAASEEL
jgi:hypothetical protein